MEASGVGHTLHPVRPVAKAADPETRSLLLRGRAGRVRGNHLHLVAGGGGALGNPGDKGSRRVTGKARIVVGDGENPHL